MEKIKFQSPDGTVEEFYIEEQTMIGGVSYLLVSDSMDGKQLHISLRMFPQAQSRKPAMRW